MANDVGWDTYMANDLLFHYTIATTDRDSHGIQPQEDSEYIVIRESAEPLPQRH